MKINWGSGIAIFYVAFVIAVLSFVFWVAQFKPDMVTEDYYAEELKYQETIDKKERVYNLEGEVIVDANVSTITISLPSGLAEQTVNGVLYLYRQSDEDLDMRFDFDGNDLEYTFDSDKIIAGSWTVKLNWNSEGEEYYYEKKIWVK